MADAGRASAGAAKGQGRRDRRACRRSAGRCAAASSPAFGPKPNGQQNDGINLAVPEGTPVKAAEDGVVAYAGNELKGYGNLVLVRHANGFVTAYAHASEIMVKRDEPVKRGQVIAKSGQTGNVTAPQLHFEIRKGSTPVDPMQYLDKAARAHARLSGCHTVSLPAAAHSFTPSRPARSCTILPGDAAGARAARRRPFERLARAARRLRSECGSGAT